MGVLQNEARQLKLGQNKSSLTHRTKLATKPAPAAARVSCGIDSGAGVDDADADEEYARMAFWKAVYATKTEAVSAIEPAKGAGRP